MEYKIIHLPKEQWQDHILPCDYEAVQYYDVAVERHQTDFAASGFSITIEKKYLASPLVYSSSEEDFPDRLYQKHWEDACAWGVIENGELIATIETCPEKWSNRLRVTEVWVAEGYRKQGIGHAMMEIVKEQAQLERRRAVVLETQSCNTEAVDFYLHEGFTLIGLDTCGYGNDDLQRKKVHLELGWLLSRKQKLLLSDVDIRMEKPEDWQAVEKMTRAAFWNYHQPGCEEHYFVHELRQHPDYLPQISRIACKDGEVIGCIMYSKAYVREDSRQHNIVTFGPLCVAPEWKGCGIGEMLLLETMKLAAAEGYPGIVIYGEPDYYPRVGFRTCEHFLISTKDGKNFDAFMGIELIEGGMKKIKGKFYESEVFDTIPREEVEIFDRQFEPLKKQYFPCQWELVNISQSELINEY